MKNNRNFLAISRCSPFPVLEKDCMDYSEMHAYKIDDPVVCTETQAIINHNVVGDNLVSQLLASKKACFGCIVASPYTCFRQLQLADAEPQGKTCQKQSISWKSEDVINPVFFQPVVIFCKDDRDFILSDDHGVDNLWLGRKVNFGKGTFIARYNILKTLSALQSLFCFVRDSNMDEGTLRIALDEQMDYKVIVKVADNLYQALSRHSIKPEHRRSIMSQALTGALAKFALEENKESGFWKKYSNLTTIYNILQDMDIPTWDDDEFDPALAALKFHPHIITEEIEE